MKFKVMIAAALLCTSLSAAADSAVIQEAYEIALSDLQLPSDGSGTIAFKKCRSCEYISVRVGADTSYKINDEAVPLKRFREMLSIVENRDAQPVTVLRHVERNQVTAVFVKLRGLQDE